MIKSTVLYKIILKAVKNGYLVPKDVWIYDIDVSDDLNDITIIWDYYYQSHSESNGRQIHECDPFCCGRNKGKTYNKEEIIYSRDFAKAFFGEDFLTKRALMMATDDPIGHLEKLL